MLKQFCCVTPKENRREEQFWMTLIERQTKKHPKRPSHVGLVPCVCALRSVFYVRCSFSVSAMFGRGARVVPAVPSCFTNCWWCVCVLCFSVCRMTYFEQPGAPNSGLKLIVIAAWLYTCEYRRSPDLQRLASRFDEDSDEVDKKQSGKDKDACGVPVRRQSYFIANSSQKQQRHRALRKVCGLSSHSSEFVSECVRRGKGRWTWWQLEYDAVRVLCGRKC